MRIINRPQTNPYFNIAAEEYLLKTIEKDCFMLWRNEPAIIVGKHQNALAEINYPLVRQNNIPVIRRITGGGTVFHDPGNINFSFIANGERNKLVDFRRFTQPIIDFLKSLGLPAVFEGKNDIRINGLKVSGNAEHVYKNKVLHHGTLLFDSSLALLNDAIRVTKKRFQDKAVQSVRSSVANISELLTQPISVEAFNDKLLLYIHQYFPDNESYNFSENDLEGIYQLVDEKYKTWEWNFGYSPDYKFENNTVMNSDLWEISMKVEKGKITSIQVLKNQTSDQFVDKVEELVIGKKHNFAEMNEIFDRYLSASEIQELSKEHLMQLLF